MSVELRDVEKMESSKSGIRQYAIRAFGIDIEQIPGINVGLTEDEGHLLTKIREYQRRSRFVPARFPGEDFEIDEELSRQCCSHGWN